MLLPKIEGATRSDSHFHPAVKDEAEEKQNTLPDNLLSEDGEGDDEDVEQVDAEATDDLLEKMNMILDGAGEPYEPEKEPLPDVPAYRKEFRRVEGLVEMIFEQAASVFERSEYRDEFTQRLLRTLDELKAPQYPEAKVLAFFGDSGVGKSSLINSILDSPYLSAKGSSGSACTCVITEYRNASESQKTPFKAEVEFYKNGVIESMLKEHYANYFGYYVEQPEDLDGVDDLQVVESHATTAKEIFHVLYADRPEFANDKLAKEFLNSGESEKDKKVLNPMIKWAKELIRSQGNESGIISLNADTAEELSRKLEPFAEMRSKLDDDVRGSASYWPLVRLVRVWLKSPLLARGLVIADLPGISDTNRTRQRTTSQYLRSCAYTVIVAQIKRVLTDPSTHAKLMSAISRPGKTKLLICTMIDDMESATKADKICSNVIGCREHERLFGIYLAKKKENQQFAKSLKKLRGRERRDAERVEKDRDEEEHALESMVLDSLVNLRNANINHEIHKKYEEHSENARTLAVHFVSNRDYAKHLDGYKRTRIPLPVSTTGIPKLRYRLSSIPADDKKMVLDHYYKGSLRSHLDTLSIWSSQTPLERQTELMKAIERPCKLVHGAIKMYICEFRETMKTLVMQPLVKSSTEWVDCGLEKWENWNKMKPASFNAWCKKDGDHETQAHPRLNWNDDLLKAVTKTFGDLWPSLQQTVTERNDVFSADLHRLIDGIRDDLHAIPGASLQPLTPFLKSLTTKKEYISKEVRTFHTAWEFASGAAFDIATSSAHDGALLEAMLPIYSELVEVKGKGQVKKRKADLETAVAKGAPFLKIRPRVNEIFDSFFQEQEKKLSLSLTKIFDDVLEDYKLQSVQDEEPNERRDALKEEVKEFLKDADEKYNGLIAEEYARALAPPRKVEI